MRIIPLAAVAVLLASAVPAPSATADHGLHLPDGVTAKITTGFGFANSVFTPGPNGNYRVLVTIWQDVDGVWQRVALGAALRVFTWGDHVATASADTDPSDGDVGLAADASFTADWTDRLLLPFTSDADGPVILEFPASTIDNTPDHPNGFDLFVTFSELGGNPVPTSHHNVAKNLLIDAFHYDEADALDFHGAQPVIGA